MGLNMQILGPEVQQTMELRTIIGRPKELNAMKLSKTEQSKTFF